MQSNRDFNGQQGRHLPFFPRFIFLALQQQGFSEAQVFKGLGLSSADLDHEKCRLTDAEHERFILNALEITGNPHLALELTSYYPKASHFVVMAMINSGQIARALHLLVRYNSIISRTFVVREVNLEDDVLLDVEPQVQHPSVAYFALSSLALFLNWLFSSSMPGRNIVRCLELSIPRPNGFDLVAADFGFEIVFSQTANRIYLDRDFLDKPLWQADPQTVRLILEMCERALVEAESEVDLVSRVKLVLIDNLAAAPGLRQLATHLGMSVTSLRRKLAEAGTSYQTLLDSLRYEVSLKLLKQTSEPVATIAYELGFKNPSDFGRAFKKWSGKSPTAIRD